MARNFDGTNDNIGFGSDASIDGDGSTTFVDKSVAFWFRPSGTGGGTTQTIVGKGSNAEWQVGFGSSNTLFISHGFSTTAGIWTGSGQTLTDGTAYHVAIVYNNSATTNDPEIYVDGVSISRTETTTPVGSASSDAAVTLVAGENKTNTNDLSAMVGWMTYTDAAWTAAQVNRHRWWGRPGGALKVHHPFLTTKLANEGTATADGTASGTTVASIPKVMRPGCGGW